MGGPLKISDQNNWGGTEQKIKFGGGAKFKGEPKILGGAMNIVGNRLTPPFLRFPPFLEIQDVPTFHRSFRKTKLLNNSCNQFLYNFYPQIILVLEEGLQKW